MYTDSQKVFMPPVGTSIVLCIETQDLNE